MKNAILRLSALLTAVCLIAGIPLAFAADGYDYAYTYTYDYWEEPQESPDAYRVATVIDSMTLGLENLEGVRISKAQSLYVRDNLLYVCDTSNNRIIEILRKGNSFSVRRIIREMQGGSENTLAQPYDVFADPAGNI